MSVLISEKQANLFRLLPVLVDECAHALRYVLKHRFLVSPNINPCDFGLVNVWKKDRRGRIEQRRDVVRYRDTYNSTSVPDDWDITFLTFCLSNSTPLREGLRKTTPVFRKPRFSYDASVVAFHAPLSLKRGEFMNPGEFSKLISTKKEPTLSFFQFRTGLSNYVIKLSDGTTFSTTGCGAYLSPEIVIRYIRNEFLAHVESSDAIDDDLFKTLRWWLEKAILNLYDEVMITPQDRTKVVQRLHNQFTRDIKYYNETTLMMCREKLLSLKNAHTLSKLLEVKMNELIKNQKEFRDELTAHRDYQDKMLKVIEDKSDNEEVLKIIRQFRKRSLSDDQRRSVYFLLGILMNLFYLKVKNKQAGVCYINEIHYCLDLLGIKCNLRDLPKYLKAGEIEEVESKIYDNERFRASFHQSEFGEKKVESTIKKEKKTDEEQGQTKSEKKEIDDTPGKAPRTEALKEHFEEKDVSLDDPEFGCSTEIPHDSIDEIGKRVAECFRALFSEDSPVNEITSILEKNGITPLNVLNLKNVDIYNMVDRNGGRLKVIPGQVVDVMSKIEELRQRGNEMGPALFWKVVKVNLAGLPAFEKVYSSLTNIKFLSTVFNTQPRFSCFEISYYLLSVFENPEAHPALPDSRNLSVLLGALLRELPFSEKVRDRVEEIIMLYSIEKPEDLHEIQHFEKMIFLMGAVCWSLRCTFDKLKGILSSSTSYGLDDEWWEKCLRDYMRLLFHFVGDSKFSDCGKTLFEYSGEYQYLDDTDCRVNWEYVYRNIFYSCLNHFNCKHTKKYYDERNLIEYLEKFFLECPLWRDKPRKYSPSLVLHFTLKKGRNCCFVCESGEELKDDDIYTCDECDFRLCKFHKSKKCQGAYHAESVRNGLQTIPIYKVVESEK